MRYCSDMFGFFEEIVDPGTDDDDSGGTSGGISGGGFVKRALLVSKNPWDCSNLTVIEGFNITSNEPTNTKIRFAWKIDDKYYMIKNTGELNEIANFSVTSALSKGNSVNFLSTLTSVEAFRGKQIFPCIALQSLSTAEEPPAVKISLKGKNEINTLSKTVTSQKFSLADDENLPTILSITPDISCTGEGSVSIQCRLFDALDKATAYMDLQDAVEKTASAIQFRIVYKVSAAESQDSAKINNISVEHSYGKSVVVGEDADLYTVVQNYDLPLQMCHVTVRHSPLINSKLEAYVNFMHEPKKRKLLNIGKGTGLLQEYVLGESSSNPDKKIDASTIELYKSATPITNFSYNSETSTVSFKAPLNTEITASYDYDHDVEVWRKMTLDVTEPYNNETGDAMTRFTYTLSDSEADGKVISNVRLVMKRPTGTVKNYDLGVAPNNKKNLYSLPHIPKMSSISFSDSSVDHNYDENSQLLTVVAPKGTKLLVSYKWQGEPVTIYSLACGWAIA